MDPILYKAAKEGNKGQSNFTLADHLKRDEENGYQATPLGNTVLHVAALYGHTHFVEEVLKIVAGLLCHTNKKKETALHLAANEGHTEVVSMLISRAGGEKETLMRMTDDNGDTALHKAVRSLHLDIVKLLVKEDPDFEFPANHARETPLYLAAECGFHDALVEILESCKKPNYAAGPSNRTPLHAAVVHGHTACARLLWRWNKRSCEEVDKWGCSSLHYAVKLGLIEVVRDMLGWKKSLAYIPAGNDNDWTTTFHIAVGEGNESMINELLEHCPDCWEMLNSSGQNVLHVAILNNQMKVIKSLLKSTKCQNFIDEPDNDGNTPLHLHATSWTVVYELMLHQKAKKMLFNKDNQTPFDFSTSGLMNIDKAYIRDFLLWKGQLGRRELKVKQLKPKDEMETSVDEKMEREVERRVKSTMRTAQIHLVVATLIMTVTFTAGFTLPGGFDSDTGANKGMAVLTRETAFRSFVISDAIAFTCSAGAICSYFTMAATAENKSTVPMYKLLMKLNLFAFILQFLAMTAAVIAFVSGMYATLAHSLGLAIIVCVIGCIAFPLYFWVVRQGSKPQVLYKPGHPSNYVWDLY